MNDIWNRADPEAVDSFKLPGGYSRPDGRLECECVLGPLTGWEEELLADHFRAVPVPALVTLLLTRCIRRLGSLAPITPEPQP